MTLPRKGKQSVLVNKHSYDPGVDSYEAFAGERRNYVEFLSKDAAVMDMRDAPETGMIIEVPQTISPFETVPRMIIPRLSTGGHEIGCIIKSSLHVSAESTDEPEYVNTTTRRDAQARINPHSGEVGKVFGELYIDRLDISSFARDPLRILAPNVTINTLNVYAPMLAPWINYDQHGGNHLDLILQSHTEHMNLYGVNAILVPNNVTINNINVRCSEEYMFEEDVARVYAEDIKFNGMMLSSPVHYQNWVIGSDTLNISMPDRDNCPTWLNAEHLSNSVIGGHGMLPYFNYERPMLIKSRKMPDEVAKSHSNYFINLPSTQAINYNGTYANIAAFTRMHHDVLSAEGSLNA